MEKIIGNPIDPSASGKAVLDPPKPTIRLIRGRVRGPTSRYPLVESAVNERISRQTLNPISSIEAQLTEVRRAWAKYRSTNSRDAIYFYLSAVFALVTRWRRLNCAVKNSLAALRLQHDAPQMKAEPFCVVIYCTSDLEVADGKTRSKWSRVLRYARRAKPADQRLTDFIKSKGGLNECARRFARRPG
jgi:hypothetical protein